MTEPTRWLPEPDDSNRPFFDGARAGGVDDILHGD